MSLWEFIACLDGYAEAHGTKSSRQGAEMDEDTARALGIDGF